MSYDVDMGVSHGLDNPLGLLLAAPLESRMDGCDHHVELGKDLFRIIEGSI